MPSESKKEPTVLLAEDQKATLEAISAYLRVRHKDRFEVIGTVSDGYKLIEETMRLMPDVAVVDIAMPGIDGVAAVSELRQRGCGTKIVFLTMYWEAEFVQAAFQAGANAYVLKHRMVTDLPVAIESVLRGEQFVSPADETRRN
jgi:DNA-binding NarL/FixJ family response regulator